MLKISFCQRLIVIESYLLDLNYNLDINKIANNLSGWQKQRINIARGIYKKANLYIFDEITSNLDVITKKKVISSIFNYSLDQLVSSRQNISINQKTGIISYINGYYVFQPLNIDKYLIIISLSKLMASYFTVL